MTKTGWIAGLVALAAAGCKDDVRAVETAAAPAAQPDLRVELGDCTGPEVQDGVGLGVVDTGPGAGGPGEGTIGKGRYGTMGPADGYGVPGNASHGQRAQVPTVRIGDATQTGDLDRSIVRRYIRRKLPPIMHCYEKELAVKKDLAGTVDVDFTITSDGLVASSSATGMDPEVSSCIAAAIKSIEFPRPKGGGKVIVRYPFTFRRAGDAAAVEATAAPSEQPGAGNPLEGHEPALAACFRTQPASHGAAVIELEVDAAGAIKSSKVDGQTAGELPACVAAAMKQITARDAVPGIHRCPVTFGATPIERAP